MGKEGGPNPGTEIVEHQWIESSLWVGTNVAAGAALAGAMLKSVDLLFELPTNPESIDSIPKIFALLIIAGVELVAGSVVKNPNQIKS